ncbi:hypothetical protein F5Y08DRAFT_211682 [Xylaria arbuscula]|nr:hypothetical protein F5Y08DRAFT_211682 [Xylaria arbuscula]
MCLIRRLDCFFLNDQVCTNCAESGLHCSVTNNVPQLNPGEYFPDNDPFGVPYIPDFPGVDLSFQQPGSTNSQTGEGVNSAPDANDESIDPSLIMTAGPAPGIPQGEQLNMPPNISDLSATGNGLSPSAFLDPAANISSVQGIPALPPMPNLPDIPDFPDGFQWDFSMSPSGQTNQSTTAPSQLLLSNPPMPMNLLNQPWAPASQNSPSPQSQPAASSPVQIQGSPPPGGLDALSVVLIR